MMNSRTAKEYSDPWRTAVEDACIVSWSPFYPDDPRKTLKALIDWRVKMALDPKISEDAERLTRWFRTWEADMATRWEAEKQALALRFK